VEVEVLHRAPSLPRLYATAALTARGRTGTGSLPQRALRQAAVRVDRERLLGYQRLCGFPVGDTLPHTYPHLLGFPLQMELMARRDFPLALPGMVHLENVVTVHRRLNPSDAFDVTVRAEHLREHPKGLLVDLVTEVDVEGERVWDGRSTYLRRGRSRTVAATPVPAPEPPAGDPVAVWRLPGDLGRRYAGVSGDVNPIHLHPLTARAMGFPRAIAHGMWTCARALAALGPATAEASTSHVWFRKPVLLPSTVALAVDRRSGREVVAGLRSVPGGVDHLVLTWGPEG
jgi:acyl dehydratase